MTRINTLLIYSNPDRDPGLVYAAKMEETARRLGASVTLCDSRCGRDELLSLLAGRDMAAVLGGDGTILSAAVPAAEAGVPILGINLGNIGFMSAFDASDGDSLETVLEGRYVTDERALLSVRAERDGEEFFHAAALNDAVISAGELGRMVRVEISCGGSRVAVLRGDGIIAATPTGSTAYSLSAGGPIIDPRSDCMVLTPVCAHTPYARPIVLPLCSEVRLKAPESAVLTVDGRQGTLLEPGDSVLIGKYAKKTTLIRLQNYDFYGIIGTKLWQTQISEVGNL